jgi:hypothetical protein
MKNKILKIFAVFAALFLAFVLAGCPQAHDDLLTLEEIFTPEGGVIQAEDGEPHGGKVTNAGNKGSGTVGRCMNELNPEGDGNEHYFTITLPGAISGGNYIVKFRYASGNGNFAVKFTVNGGDVQTPGTGPGNGWDLGFSHDFVASPGPVSLKAGDKLKVWTTDWGCIDYIKLEKQEN